MLHRKKLCAAMCLAAVMAFAVSGCGNDDGDESATAVPDAAASEVSTAMPTPNMDETYNELGLFVANDSDPDSEEKFGDCYVFGDTVPEVEKTADSTTMTSERDGITISVSYMLKSDSDNIDVFGNIISPLQMTEPHSSDSIYSIVKTEEADAETLKVITIAFDVNTAKSSDEDTFMDILEAYDIDLTGTDWEGAAG